MATTARTTVVLPGRNTVGLLAVLAAMWYAGVTQGNGAAHLLCFFLAALAAVSAVHAWANLRRVRVRVGAIPPVFTGSALRVPLTAWAEAGAEPVAVQIAAGDPDGAAFFPTLSATAESSTTVTHPAPRRGCFRGLRLVVTSPYPLGFFTARRAFLATEAYCVYPLPAGTAPLPRALGPTHDRREGLRTEGDDFAGLRSWLPGESQRHIDWKAAARGQPLLTKQWAGESGEVVILAWAATPGADLEARLSQLAQWIVTAEQGGLHYGLELPGTALEPSRGAAHYHQCLRSLAAFAPEERLR